MRYCISMHTHLTFVFLYSLIVTLHFLISQVKNPLCLSAKIASVKAPDLQVPCSGPNSGLCRDRHDAFIWSLSQCLAFSGTVGLFCDPLTLIYLRIPHSAFWITSENSNGSPGRGPHESLPKGPRRGEVFSPERDALCLLIFGIERKQQRKRFVNTDIT